MIRSSLHWLKRAFPDCLRGWFQPYKPPRTIRRREYRQIYVEQLEARTLLSVTIAPTNNNGNGFDALNNTTAMMTGVPPDSQGATGSTDYINTINSAIRIYNKSTGAPITGVVLDTTFWSVTGGLAQPNAASQYFDPTVIYDDNIPGEANASGGRFILGNDDGDAQTAGVSVYDFAISKNSNPTTLTAADWTFYQIKTSEPGPLWADYPGVAGFNHDAYVVSFNMFPPSSIGGGSQHVQVDTININTILAGAPLTLNTTWFQRDVNEYTMEPASEHNAAAGAPMYFVAGPSITTLNALDVYTVPNVLSATPIAAPSVVAVTPYVSPFVPPPQPNGMIITNTVGDTIDNVALRGTTLVCAQPVSVSATQDDIQWYMLSVSGAPAIVQQGDVGLGNNTYANYPSIDINPNGDIGMSFQESGTAAGQFMSMYVTGRKSTDPANTMEAPLEVPVGKGLGNNSDGRSGDMATINIDPVDGTFWATNEFTDGTPQWAEAVANFYVTPPATTGGGGGTSGSGTLQISLDSTNDLLIQDVLPQGKNDLLTIQADATYSRYVVTDANPSSVIFYSGTVAGALLSLNNRIAYIPFSDVTGAIDITLLGGNDKLTIDNSLGYFSTIINFNGGPGVNTLVAPNQFNTWTITGTNAGNIQNTATFSNVQYLVGGTNTDLFYVTNSSLLTGEITDHGEPGDTLDYLTNYNLGPVAVILGPLNANGQQTGRATRIAAFQGISIIKGDNYAANTITGGSPPNDWVINGNNAGSINATGPGGTVSPVAFSNFDYLIGGSGANTFDFSAGGAISGTVIGVGASNKLIGPSQNQTWNITANNQGNLPGFLTSFTDIQSLTAGGGGNDIFNFANGTKMTGRLDGGAGNSWLNYSAFTKSMQINLATGADSAAGGGAVNFNNLLGSGVGGDRITGSANGGVLLTHSANNIVNAGAGRTVIIGGYGMNELIGSGSDDLLINGSTSFDNNIADLNNIMSIWQSGGTYGQRIAEEEVGPTRLVVGATVTLTPAKPTTGPRYGVGPVIYQSTLLGHGGQNWFLTSTVSSVEDLKPGEVVTT